MKLLVRLMVCSAVLFFATTLRAQDPDAEGCKDSPLVTRFPGSHIDSCDNKEFDEAELPVSRNKNGEEVTKTFEGKFARGPTILGKARATCNSSGISRPL